jgi:hypothetical protein
VDRRRSAPGPHATLQVRLAGLARHSYYDIIGHDIGGAAMAVDRVKSGRYGPRAAAASKPPDGA